MHGVEGVSYRDPLPKKNGIRVFGRVRVFSLLLTGNKGVLNKKYRLDDCQEVGSLQLFQVGERELGTFLPKHE